MKRWTGAGLVVLGVTLGVVAMLLWPQRAAPGTNEVAATAEAPAAEANAAGDVTLNTAQLQRLGVRLVTLTAATAPVLATGFARALDIAPLAAIDSEIASARAAVRASGADAARLAGLAAADQSASARSVEVARALAAADRIRTTAAQRRAGLEFGPGLAALGDAGRSALITDVAMGRAALLRIDLPGSVPVAGTRIQVGDTSATVTVLGAAASADARLQGTGVLAVLRGPAARDAGAGRLLPVTVAGGGTAAGVIVPRAAVVRWHGGLWVYALATPETDNAHFIRRELPDARAVDTGWFAASGVAAGDRIVGEGAGAVLAAERGGSSAERDK